MDELKNKSRHSSPTPRAFPILICGLCGSLLLYLSLSHKVLLPLDFLGWYYPFRAHHTFAGNNTFIANLWYQDVTFYFHPFAVVIGKMVESGNLPFWNPLIGALHTAEEPSLPFTGCLLPFSGRSRRYTSSSFYSAWWRLSPPTYFSSAGPAVHGGHL